MIACKIPKTSCPWKYFLIGLVCAAFTLYQSPPEHPDPVVVFDNHDLRSSAKQIMERARTQVPECEPGNRFSRHLLYH